MRLSEPNTLMLDIVGPECRLMNSFRLSGNNLGCSQDFLNPCTDGGGGGNRPPPP